MGTQRWTQTMICKISFRRGLPDASTTRLPTNLVIDGTRSAFGSRQLWPESSIAGFDLKKLIMLVNFYRVRRDANGKRLEESRTVTPATLLSLEAHASAAW